MSDNYLGHKSSKIAEIEWFWQTVEQVAGVASIFPPLLHVALAASNVYQRFMHYKRKNLNIKSRDFVRRYLFTDVTHKVVAWLSGSALVSINEVTLRWARLVLG